MDGRKGAKRPPMRSSIACMRCRRSKIKCDNDGKASTPCYTCIKTGKECIYPEAPPPAPKRPDPPPPIRRETESGPERKRPRRPDDVARPTLQAGTAYAEDVLSSSFLNESMWNQILELYKLHFATELPFLHMPTLKEKMGNRFRSNEKESSPETNLVLLGILTLTARFQTDLVSYVVHAAAQQSGGPKPRHNHKPDAAEAASASNYFAEALTMALGPLGNCMTMASVERVQAFLMLGLHEWIQVKPKTKGGLGAWMYVGIAIRMAQALGLGFGDVPERSDRESPPNRSLSAAAAAAESRVSDEKMIAREVRRRTMFSCLVLDRMLSCGKERVSTIQSEDLQIQLPCSEMSFDLADDVHTGFLKPTADAPERPINNDSILARFIRLVDIWGEISKYSFSGGRLTQGQRKPWDAATDFFRLRERLESFYADLPANCALTTSNYHKHENHHASSVFVALHMLGCMCEIMLHREYIPFIPIRCARPEGPLDPPLLEGAPEGFWEESAEHVFKGGGDIIRLIDICQKRDKLPMSSLVLFAIWTAAFVGIYAWHFPQMDPLGHMRAGDDEEGPRDIARCGPTGSAFYALTKMSPWLGMADTWRNHFQFMDAFYHRVQQDYEHYSRQVQSGGPSRGGGIRYAGRGGGLEEWRVQNGRIMDNGLIIEPADEGNDHGSEAANHSRGTTLIDCGPSLSHDSHPPTSAPSFTAINSTAQYGEGAAPPTSFTHDGGSNGSEMNNNNHHHQQQQHYHHHHHQQLQQQPRHQQHPSRDWTASAATVVAEDLTPPQSQSSPTQLTPYNFDMGMYYNGPNEVMRYLKANEGRRLADMGPAAGIEAFSLGSLAAPAVWVDQKGHSFGPWDKMIYSEVPAGV